MAGIALSCVSMAWARIAVLLYAAAGGKTVLDYDVEMKGEKAGTSQAVIIDTAAGRRLEIRTEVKTTYMGVAFEMRSTTIIDYDLDRTALSFDIDNTKPTGDIRVTGQRSSSGWDIVRIQGKKTKKVHIEHGSYDRVSIEPGLYGGEVGSKIKARVLLAGQGKVVKATISILGRETRKVLGRDQSVTHFRIKTSAGTIEEWRLEDGVILKSKVKTPVGDILIALREP